MKKILLLAFLSISILLVAGCENNNSKPKTTTNANFITIEPNEDEKLVINTEDITSVATFVNYKVDGVIIQFVVVRGTDGEIKIAFNTCQACNPSPNAYFIQDGDYLECQNCGNRFHINKIGIEKGGCNPAPVEEKEVLENKIIISKEYADSYKEKFENWNGPTK